MTPTLTWILVGSTIILLLFCYAAYLHWRLWQQRQLKQKQSQASLKRAQDAHQQSLNRRKSIYALANAIEEEALTLTEGCMRISAIASQLGEMESFNREFGVITRVAEETADIPILQAWKDLPKAEKRKFDRRREQIEQKYLEAVLTTLPQLKEAYRD